MKPRVEPDRRPIAERIEDYERIRDGYPEGHRERREINGQIEKLKKKEEKR